MPDFARLRSRMVEEQIRLRGVADPRVLAALEQVPRHRFVPPELAAAAYSDCALPIGGAQTISQPYIVALMSELLELAGSEKVLEVGTGSGYQAAVLSRLAREVVSIERLPDLAAEARRRLAALGYDNVRVIVADGALGWPAEAPYGGILVAAAPAEVPAEMVEQLAPGARLVIPVGVWEQDLLRVTRHAAGEAATERVIPVRFVPLVGGG